MINAYAVVILKEIVFCVNLVEYVEHRDNVFCAGINGMEEQIRPIHSNPPHAIHMVSNVVDNDVILRNVC